MFKSPHNVKYTQVYKKNIFIAMKCKNPIVSIIIEEKQGGKIDEKDWIYWTWCDGKKHGRTFA
jgi:hypothetical protein